MKNKLARKSAELTSRLQAIDYNQLPISDYNKQYISTLIPVLDYYMKIYSACLLRGLKLAKVPAEEIVFVDYGGGSGFLSMLAKEIGIKKVIYVDLNPLSVKTITLLKEKMKTGPDIIIEGNSDRLAAWCEEEKVKPQLLVATDLIEHVYDLRPFFTDLVSTSPDLVMLFTTASTPYNPIVKRRLHQMMRFCEQGDMPLGNYRTLRYRFIEKHRTTSPEELSHLADQSRGMTYDDILYHLEKQLHFPIPTDKYNTCDPVTGNWVERILPIRAYKELLRPHDYTVRVEKGFYNTQRDNRLYAFICRCINFFIRFTGKGGLLLAPFIILVCRKPKRA